MRRPKHRVSAKTFAELPVEQKARLRLDGLAPVDEEKQWRADLAFVAGRMHDFDADPMKALQASTKAAQRELDWDQWADWQSP